RALIGAIFAAAAEGPRSFAMAIRSQAEPIATSARVGKIARGAGWIAARCCCESGQRHTHLAATHARIAVAGRAEARGQTARCGARQAFENVRVPIPSRADTSRGGGVCREPDHGGLRAVVERQRYCDEVSAGRAVK